MNVREFCDCMERIAPKALAKEYDNVGLLVPPERTEIKRVLLALDCTPVTVAEAIELEADLILTHHPILFRPIRTLDGNTSELACIRELLKHGIGMFAAHTNLDGCIGGVNDCLAERLGLTDVLPMPSDPLGRMGKLPQEITLKAFAELCRETLHNGVQVLGDLESKVRTVGMVGGSGGDEAVLAKQDGCDVFLTGEMKHHEALEAQHAGICCVVAGHYETEMIVLKSLATRLQNEFFDVEYTVTRKEQAVLPCF